MGDSTNSTDTNKFLCEDGTFIPVWEPTEGLSTEEMVGRGVVYILAMYFLFIGIAYLADIFMSAIEMITSTKKEVKIINERGEEEVVVVRIWNQTIANLSLIALGGAAPEVFMASITLITNGFEAEELGPSQIVASASFNCMVIIGVCIVVIPKGESRTIQNFEVFLVVLGWSVFAYVWLVLMMAVISPGEIEIWEGLVTLALFPISLLCAYLADRQWGGSSKTTTYQLGFKNKVLVETTTTEKEQQHSIMKLKRFSGEEDNDEFREFEEHRRDFIIALKELRRQHPLMDSKQLELLATKELMDRGSKSKAFFKMKASKKLTGLSSWRMRQESNRVDLGIYQRPSIDLLKTNEPKRNPNITEVYFSPGHYTIEEDVGVFTATVVRQNGDLSRQVLVDYATEDADAIAGRDYSATRGTLCFSPGQTKKLVEIPIMDDLVYEGDQHFYIRLFNLRFGMGEKGKTNINAYLVPEIQRSRSNSAIALLAGRRGSNVPIGRALIVPPNGFPKSRSSADHLLMPSINGDARKYSLMAMPGSSNSVRERSSTNPHNKMNEVLLNVQTIPTHLTTLYGIEDNDDDGGEPMLQLVCPSLATVLIMDDDHNGIFTLAKAEISIKDKVPFCAMQIIRCGGTRGRVILPYKTEEGTAMPDKDYKHCEGELVFENGEMEKIVSVPIIPDNVYTEDLLFFFALGEPMLVDDGKEKRRKSVPAIVVEDTMTEEQKRIADEGLPHLGEIPKTAIRLEESKAFKNVLHRMVKRSQLSLKRGTSPWKQQFIDAVHWERDEDYEEEFGKPKPITWVDYFKYPLTIFWRLLFALIPPPELFGGFATFLTCIFIIAISVIFLGDFAYALGCTVGLELRVTSLAFVSVGTSVPDLFASRVFAKRSPTADACVTNVFGSNIIQVYLGMGICWSMGSIYHSIQGTKFLVDPGTLSFMATYFILNVCIVVTTLILRRFFAGGELGGATKIKIPTTIGFILLWLTFVLVNSFEAYNYFTVF